MPFDRENEAGLTPMQEAERRLGFVRDAAGDRFAALEIESPPFFTEITDDVDAAIARVASIVRADPDVVAHHPNVLLGSEDHVVETLLAQRDRLAVTYVTVQQSQLERFAPVVARLSGR